MARTAQQALSDRLFQKAVPEFFSNADRKSANAERTSGETAQVPKQKDSNEDTAVE